MLIAKGRWGAKELKKLLRHTTRAIVVIVIFTNVTNILGPILIGQKAIQLFGNDVIGYITAMLTLATIVFSEIIPKSLGAHHAPRISRRAAPFLLALVTVLYPIVYPLERLARLFRTSGKRKVGTEEQIRALANIGGGAGHIDADERELIHRAFVLNDRKAKEIMTKPFNIISIQKDATIRQAADIIFANHFSRYPLIGDSLSDINGYVLSRDVLAALAYGKNEDPVTSVRRELLSVDASVPCDDLLNILRSKASQIAVVAERGKIIGLVTLEDILGQLVGKIKDEGDVGL